MPLSRKISSRATALLAKALSPGASDEGAYGESTAGFYVDCFRDPGGQKLDFFHVG